MAAEDTEVEGQDWVGGEGGGGGGWGEVLLLWVLVFLLVLLLLLLEVEVVGGEVGWDEAVGRMGVVGWLGVWGVVL